METSKEKTKLNVYYAATFQFGRVQYRCNGYTMWYVKPSETLQFRRYPATKNFGQFYFWKSPGEKMFFAQ